MSGRTVHAAKQDSRQGPQLRQVVQVWMVGKLSDRVLCRYPQGDSTSFLAGLIVLT